MLLVQRVIHEQWTYAEVAEGSGLSVRTVAKWVRRYRQGGTAALEDRSSRPGPPRHQTPAVVVAGMRHLRETKRWPAWFAAQGVTCQRVMSDNGSGYVSRVFTEHCQAMALRHLRTRPYTPRTNGKVERFIQTLQREWAYARPYQTSQARRRALRPWLRYYNQGRPHASLNYQPSTPVGRVMNNVLVLNT